nr:hypothetical protein CFP56_53683 [Quercus suber]
MAAGRMTDRRISEAVTSVNADGVVLLEARRIDWRESGSYLIRHTPKLQLILSSQAASPDRSPPSIDRLMPGDGMIHSAPTITTHYDGALLFLHAHPAPHPVFHLPPRERNDRPVALRVSPRGIERPPRRSHLRQEQCRPLGLRETGLNLAQK